MSRQNVFKNFNEKPNLLASLCCLTILFLIALFSISLISPIQKFLCSTVYFINSSPRFKGVQPCYKTLPCFTHTLEYLTVELRSIKYSLYFLEMTKPKSNKEIKDLEYSSLLSAETDGRICQKFQNDLIIIKESVKGRLKIIVENPSTTEFTISFGEYREKDSSMVMTPERQLIARKLKRKFASEWADFNDEKPYFVFKLHGNAKELCFDKLDFILELTN